MEFNVYEVIFRLEKDSDGALIKTPVDIRPYRLLASDEVFNIRDYSLKDLRDILHMNYTHLSSRIIDSKKHTIDDVLKDINKYLINNHLIIFKDYIEEV